MTYKSRRWPQQSEARKNSNQNGPLALWSHLGLPVRTFWLMAPSWWRKWKNILGFHWWRINSMLTINPTMIRCFRADGHHYGTHNTDGQEPWERQELTHRSMLSQSPGVMDVGSLEVWTFLVCNERLTLNHVSALSQHPDLICPVEEILGLWSNL